MGDTFAADRAAGNAANMAKIKVIAPLIINEITFSELFSAINAWSSVAF